MFECLKAIIMLPFNVIIVIPALILYFSNYTYKTPNTLSLIISLILLSMGIFLLAWTIILFYNVGKGTLAPWNPPKNFVVKGPYRYVRNPNIFIFLKKSNSRKNLNKTIKDTKKMLLCGYQDLRLGIYEL